MGSYFEGIGDIIQIMEINKCPFYELTAKKGEYGNPFNIQSFHPASEKEEEKIEEAKKALEQQAQMYQGRGWIFIIRMRPSKTSNQGTLVGPHEFVIDKELMTKKQGTGGLGGFGNPAEAEAQGYVSRNTLNELLDIRDQRIKLQYEQEKIEDRKREIEEKEKEIEKRSAVPAKALEKAFWKITETLGLLDDEKEEKPEKGVGGTDIEKAAQDELEKIAGTIFETLKTPENIAGFGRMIGKLMTKYKEQNGTPGQHNEE